MVDAGGREGRGEQLDEIGEDGDVPDDKLVMPRRQKSRRAREVLELALAVWAIGPCIYSAGAEKT